MKPSLAKIAAIFAAAIGLMGQALAQIGPPPPPPPSESVETLSADYARIVTGTISEFDPSGSRYGERNAILEVHQVLKGDRVSKLNVRLREETSTFAGWKLHQDLLLVGIPKAAGKELAVVDLSDPKMAVLNEALRLLRTAEAVTQAVQETLPKQIAPGRFLLELPSQFVIGTSLDVVRRRSNGPAVNLPIDPSLESAAHRVLASKDINARCSAVDALENFKSDANVRLLQRLLHDDQYSVTGQPQYHGGIEQHNFLVREHAFNVLSRWGLNPEPVETKKDADVLPELTQFYSQEPPKTEVLERLVRSNRLTDLGIFGGPIDDTQVELIGRLTHLRNLSLSNVGLTDHQFSYLKNLKELQTLGVNGDSITDASLPLMAQFKGLKSVFFARAPISKEGFDSLKKAFPNAELVHWDEFRAASPMLRQTQADCNRTVYTLQPRDRRLSAWSSIRTGRLTGSLQWSKSPSGRNYIGPFGQQAVTLNLKNLRPHQNLEVDIDLWVIGSWDGDGSLAYGPDIIDISIPNVGTAMHASFFNNDDGPGAKDFPLQSFPDPYPLGRHVAYTGASEVRTLGFSEPWDGIQYHRDAVYKLRYTFAHTGSDFAVTITGENVPQPNISELTKDEHWGIGGVRVKTD